MENRRRWRSGLWVVVLGLALFLAAAAFAGELRLPPDLIYSKADGSPGKVTFSHQLHVGLSEKCTACHNTHFRILRPTRRVTHADMEAGRSCGACHNGALAFGSTDPAGCERCHGGGKAS
jgi:c(7)-type cytochrome triheme protein